MKILISILMLCLIGCATKTKIVVQEVKVPVIMPCVITLPDAPKLFSDTELLKLNNMQFIDALYVDRLRSQAYIGELLATLNGCI
jgi:hypothetical protein